MMEKMKKLVADRRKNKLKLVEINRNWLKFIVKKIKKGGGETLEMSQVRFAHVTCSLCSRHKFC